MKTKALILILLAGLISALMGAIPGPLNVVWWADDGGSEALIVDNNGAFAHWRFEEVSENPRLDQVSTNHLIEYIVGVAQANGKELITGDKGLGPGFGAGVGLVRTNHSLDLSAMSFSINCWASWGSISTNVHFAIWHSSDAAKKQIRIYSPSNGVTGNYRFVAELYDGATSQVVTSSVAASTIQYQMITVTYDKGASELKTYMNGGNAITGTTINAAQAITGVVPFTMFNYANGTGGSHSSWLDELTVWKNMVLSQAEITALYNSGNGIPFPFNFNYSLYFTTDSPEGSVKGAVGMLNWDALNQAFYIKETGTGNTGWTQLLAAGAPGLTFQLSFGGSGVVITNVNPEATITASPGTICWDVTLQTLHLKQNGVSTTGWVQLLSTGYDAYAGAISSGGSGTIVSTGNPEGAVTALAGKMFFDTAARAWYLKQSGGSSTGWIQLLVI